MAVIPATVRVAQNCRAPRGIFWNNVVLQRFIERRSRALDCALVSRLGLSARCGGHVPAVVRVDTLRDGAGQSGDLPRIRLRHPVGSFPLDSLLAPLAFNILDICAVMVLIGVFTAMWRRGRIGAR